MLYNQTKTSCGTVMPLLMGCTKPQLLQEMEVEQPVYDPMKQLLIYDMRIIGTYSLKATHWVKKPENSQRSDKKNEIDDQKNVK